MKIFWFLNKKPNTPANPALGAQLQPLRWIVWVVFVVLGVFLAWANWASINRVTRATGSVIASSRTQVIQSQDGGTIENMLVKEGDVVKAGQVLVQFEKTRAQTGFLEARAKAVGLAASVARLQAEVLGTPLQFPPEIRDYPEFERNQRLLYTKRRSAIDEEIRALTEIARLAKVELDITQPLLKTGDVSLTDVLRLQRQLADINSQITNKRNKYLQDAQAELNKAQEDLAGMQQTLEQRQSQLTQTELTAPLHGVVKNVRITTRGGVVRAGEEVMQIVPLDDDLVVQARVPPADIAFLRNGMKARIKIDAYDYTVYGELPGELIYISPDTLTEDLRQGEEPYYRVRAKALTRRFSGKPDTRLDIQPGMTATLEIQTGERTVFQYLTKPLVKTVSESLGEK